MALLQVVAEFPEERLRHGLSLLQAAEFLYETRLFPDLEYTFKHALTHEVAYGTLLLERRRLLHGRIADAIQTLYPDRLAEHVERLAHHAVRAEQWDKALAHCRRAGEKTFDRSATREAVMWFEHAIETLNHLPANRIAVELGIDLRFRLRSSLYILGEYERAFQCIRDAERLTELLSDQHRRGWVFAYLTDCFLESGDYDQAIESGQQALALGRAVADSGIHVVANHYLAVAHFYRGDYRTVIEFHTRVTDKLDEHSVQERFGLSGLPGVFARTFFAFSHSELGEFVDGIRHGENGLEIAEAAKHPYSHICATLGLGYLYLRKGSPDQAVSLLERGLLLSRAWDIPHWFPLIASILGASYALAGRPSDAVPLLEQGVKTLQVGGQACLRSLALGLLGEAYLLVGRVDDAAEQAGRALGLSRQQTERGWEAWTLRLLGEIASRRDPIETQNAEDSYRQGLALATDLGMRPLVAHCRLGLGRIHRQIGQRDQAQEHLTTATTMYREMDMRFWLEKAEAEMTQAG